MTARATQTGEHSARATSRAATRPATRDRSTATAAARAVVAMSGGVDSSVAAALALESGLDCIAVFMRTGATFDNADAADATGTAAATSVRTARMPSADPSSAARRADPSSAARPAKQGCCSLADSLDARAVAGRLGLPFYSVNHEGDFRKLIRHFVAEYARGRTPNPCVVCNREIKFDSLLAFADNVFAPTPASARAHRANTPAPTSVVTGHHARLRCNADTGRHEVWRGRDADKDQSYVLWPLSQDQLARSRMPVGELTKDEVRERAAALGLRTADKPESQDICFVPGGDYRAVIAREAPGSLRPGPIVDTGGRELGQHLGHQGFTIGQRRGLGIAAARPLYVVAVDAETNTVVVGDEADVLASACIVDEVNWVSLAPLLVGERFDCEVQVRYHQHPIAARATVLPPQGAPSAQDSQPRSQWRLRHAPESAVAPNRSALRLRIEFDEPVPAVAPGQCAVCYGRRPADDPGRLLAGGWIAQAIAVRGESPG